MIWENTDEETVKLVALHHAALQCLDATIRTDTETNQVQLLIYGDVMETWPMSDDMIASIYRVCAVWASQVCAACTGYPEA